MTRSDRIKWLQQFDRLASQFMAENLCQRSLSVIQKVDDKTLTEELIFHPSPLGRRNKYPWEVREYDLDDSAWLQTCQLDRSGYHLSEVMLGIVQAYHEWSYMMYTEFLGMIRISEKLFNECHKMERTR